MKAGAGFRLSVVAGAIAVATGAAMCVWQLLRAPETVIVAIGRKQVARVPPMPLDSDAERYASLVLQPLCPQPDSSRPLLLPVPALAECSDPDPKTGAIEIRLPKPLQLGGHSLSVQQAAELAAKSFAAHTGLEAPNFEPVATQHRLRVLPTRGDGGAELRARLAEVSLFEQDEAGCARGTGAWRADCGVSDQLPSKHVAWNAIPPTIRELGAVSDLTVLETGSWWDGRKRVVQFGLDFTDIAPVDRPSPCAGSPEAAVAAVDLLLGQRHQIAAALLAALEGPPDQRLHLLRHVESDTVRCMEQLRSPATQRPWGYHTRASARAVWLVSNPSLPKSQRLSLLQQVRAVVRDASFYDEATGAVAPALLPAVLPPLHFAGARMGSEQTFPPATDGVRLLTHHFWAPLAQRLIERAPGLRLTQVAPDAESLSRNARDYELSMLAVVARDRSHPARLLADNLSLWFQQDDRFEDGTERRILDMGRSLSLREAAGQDVHRELIAFLQQLDDYIVPVSSPPVWFAVHQDLVGWNAAAERLDPDQVGLRSDVLRTAGKYGLALFGLGAVIIGVSLLVQREVGQRHLQLIRQLDGLHHDLAAPLSSIRNEADALAEDLAPALADPMQRQSVRESAATIDREVDAALLLVDALQVVVQPDAIVAVHSVGQCALVAQVLMPLLTVLRTRAERDGVDVAFDLETPPWDPVVRLPLAAAHRIVGNVLENAIKYRAQGKAARIGIALVASEGAVRLTITDHGMGFDPEQPTNYFFGLRQRGAKAQRAGIPGTGMGLAVTRGLLVAVGGSVEIVQSGQPTRILLRLPLANRQETVK